MRAQPMLGSRRPPISIEEAPTRGRAGLDTGSIVVASVPAGDPDPGRLFFRMSRAARQWRVQIDRAVKDSGLTECTLRPLLYLERMGDGVRQRDLANAMWVDASVMVRLVDVLEAAGHVSRLTEDRDRRFNKLFLTQSGRELLAKVRGKTDAIHRNLLSRSSPAERAACLRLFAALERMSVVAPST